MAAHMADVVLVVQEAKMSEQIESKATEEEAVAAAEEAVEATIEAADAAADAVEEDVAEITADAAVEVAEVEAAAEEAVAEIVEEAAEIEASVEEAVADAVEEAAEIEESVEEAVAEAIDEGVDDETVAEMIDAAAEIEEAAEESVAEVIAEADAVEEVVEEAAAEAIAEVVAEAEAVEEVAVEAVEEAVAEAEAVEEIAAEAVEEAVAEAAIVEEAVEEAAAEAVEEAVAEVAAAAETGSDDGAAATETDDESGRVVRVLSVGMEVDGTVKRITDFGAFVDIGVGRDGLIHISELSVRRVAKVSDVLKEGQEVKAWIKQLDRERNRISLTLIPPGVVTIRDLEKGDLVNGTVTRIVPYGAFVDIGVGRDALLHIREMAEGYVKRPEDVVQVGEELEARIIDLSKRRGRIDLSIKGLRPEPEAAAPVEEATAAAPDEDEDLEDPFADVEVLSPIELAFQKAMAENEDDVTGMRRKKGKRARRAEQRAIQDEIIARTLEGRE